MTRAQPLRRTLVVGIIVLVTVLTAAVGTFSTIALRNDLIERLDTQLATATDRSFDQFAPNGKPPGSRGAPPGAEVLGMPGQREGTIAGLSRNGEATSAQVIASDGKVRNLTDEELAALNAGFEDGTPRTVEVSGLGSYRMIMRTAQQAGGTSNTGSSALIMGLPLADTNATVLQLSLLIGAAGLAGIVLTAFAGTLFVRAALRPLDRIAEAATQVAEMPLHQGDVALPVRVEQRDARPESEVGQVGQALNILLDHVSGALSARQESEEKLRQFVADASHELRTPIASIRGYAELTRRSPEQLPESAVHTLGRIESESVRMTKIVEDLLLLARLDEGTEVRTEPVNLTQLIVDAVSDASAAGGDHEWLLDVPETGVTITGDSMRLHQVLMNLLNNARVHTPAGTAVTAALRLEADTTIVEIRDDGPGIDEALAAAVFERFVRGDASRARHTGGTGLGLAIASAIVDAHDGELSLESRPGETVFRIRLPAATAPGRVHGEQPASP